MSGNETGIPAPKIISAKKTVIKYDGLNILRILILIQVRMKDFTKTKLISSSRLLTLISRIVWATFNNISAYWNISTDKVNSQHESSLQAGPALHGVLKWAKTSTGTNVPCCVRTSVLPHLDCLCRVGSPDTTKNQSSSHLFGNGKDESSFFAFRESNKVQQFITAAVTHGFWIFSCIIFWGNLIWIWLRIGVRVRCGGIWFNPFSWDGMDWKS